MCLSDRKIGVAANCFKGLLVVLALFAFAGCKSISSYSGLYPESDGPTYYIPGSNGVWTGGRPAALMDQTSPAQQFAKTHRPKWKEAGQQGASNYAFAPSSYNNGTPNNARMGGHNETRWGAQVSSNRNYQPQYQHLNQNTTNNRQWYGAGRPIAKLSAPEMQYVQYGQPASNPQRQVAAAYRSGCECLPQAKISPAEYADQNLSAAVPQGANVAQKAAFYDQNNRYRPVVPPENNYNGSVNNAGNGQQPTTDFVAVGQPGYDYTRYKPQ